MAFPLGAHIEFNEENRKLFLGSIICTFICYLFLCLLSAWQNIFKRKKSVRIRRKKIIKEIIIMNEPLSLFVNCIIL